MSPFDFMYMSSLAIFGIVAYLTLFYDFPTLDCRKPYKSYTVAVIIPMRNERHNIENLLHDLSKQTVRPDKVICVDDESTDGTAEAVLQFDEVDLIRVTEKASDWTGKAYACHVGAKSAQQQLLLFLDADVRLTEDALQSLLAHHEHSCTTISVQPYHNVRAPYEHMSMFFNIVQTAANGVTSPHKVHAGLFGPCILIENELYKSVGGHQCAKDSVVDDVQLGQRLAQTGNRYRLLLGGRLISFRMYPQGVRSLAQGWIKNFATGSAYTHPFTFILTVIFLTGITATQISLVQSLLFSDNVGIPLFAALCVAYGLLTFRAVRYLGNFSWLFILFYPILLFVFMTLFILSIIKKLLRLPVKWKGRNFNPR